MKGRFITLLLIAASILVMTACKVGSPDTDEVKIIKKPGTEAAGNNGNDKNSDLNEKGKVLQQDTEEYIKSIIEGRAAEVLSAIKNNDMKEFSRAVHPVKGVRFSPYAYVNVNDDLLFTADKISNIESDSTEYIWGSYDGSGEPIKFTFSGYYKKFIYDQDFINAKEVGYNKILGKGNTKNNSFEVYNNSIIVEYHFPGFNPEYNGIDWESLRLVFEKADDTWYVVGVIHDQWTI